MDRTEKCPRSANIASAPVMTKKHVMPLKKGCTLQLHAEKLLISISKKSIKDIFSQVLKMCLYKSNKFQ